MDGDKQPLQRWGVWIPSPLLNRLRDLAAKKGMTAPKLLVLVLTRLLDGPSAEVGLDEKSSKANKGRLFITLTQAERAAVKVAAKADGYSLSGWVACLIRARLGHRAIFTVRELEALSEATLKLSAIGRTLNSAVYILHRQGIWQETPVQLQLDPLAHQIREVTRRMNAIIEVAGDRGKL